jgi:nucleoside-diphosphate-sugar epimerase
MGNVLILGGTGWLGREVARAALASGDEVTCLARGESGVVPDGAELVRADRARAGAYAEVVGRDWSHVVELSWENDFVVGALEALVNCAAHWTLISTISVYASNANAGTDESDPVVEPVDLEDYGQAKVAAERASEAALDDRLMIVRPGLIAGPGDPSDRFGYWVGRMALARAEPVLSMAGADRTVQVIDVRDVAEFAARASGTGILNAVGDSIPLVNVLDRAAAVAGFDGTRIEAADQWLEAHDVHYWAGPRSLPLWLPPADAPMTTRSNAAFLAAGGELRDLDHTLRDTLRVETKRGLNRDRRSGLTRADELALLQQLH